MAGIFILAGTVPLYGQESVQVDLQAGWDSQLFNRIEQETQEVLQAIHRDEGYGELPEILQQLLMGESFRVETENYTVHPLQIAPGRFEVRGLKLLRTGNHSGREELVLRFDRNGQVADAEFAPVHQRYQEIITSRVRPGFREENQVEKALSRIQDAFEREDVQWLKRHISPSALLITGSRDQQSERYRYQRFRTVESYFRQLQQSLFQGTESLQVDYDILSVHQHPDYDHLRAVVIQQYLNTEGYEENGYLTMILDLSEPDRPVLSGRVWQSEPFDVEAPVYRTNILSRRSLEAQSVRLTRPVASVQPIERVKNGPGLPDHRTYWQRNRTWILVAGTSAVLVGSALLFVDDDAPQPPPIPAPPGRP